MVLRLSAEADFFGGVSWHPSHTPISGLLGESAAELVKGIKCPQLVCPAGMLNNQKKKELDVVMSSLMFTLPVDIFFTN